jgi:hypothetical protein
MYNKVGMIMFAMRMFKYFTCNWCKEIGVLVSDKHKYHLQWLDDLVYGYVDSVEVEWSILEQTV